MTNAVALILDQELTQGIELAIADIPAWIACSDCDEGRWNRLRASRQLKASITTFPIKDGESRSAAMDRIIDTLDDHHNEDANDEPYDTLLVFGLQLAEADLTRCRSLGFSTFEKTELGFIAQKGTGSGRGVTH